MHLLKDDKYLTEDYRVVDLFDFKQQALHVEEYIAHSPDKSLIGLVGEYGSGKSTLLHQSANKQAHTQLWFWFDAWKYPERGQLWEGFILDLAQQYGKQDKILRNIEGKQSKSETIFAGFVQSIYATLNKIPVAPDLQPLVNSTIQAFQASPATRVFQLQNLLQALINTQEQPLVIVIEDIDRSGDKGVYFLETLNHFLKNAELNKFIKVIVPMSPKNYSEGLESYQKCLDFVTYFKPLPPKMKTFTLQTFHEDLFNPDLLEKPSELSISNSSSILIGQLSSFLEEIMSQLINPRLLKSLLREWKLNYERHEALGYKPDYRVELAIQSTKYIHPHGGNFFNNLLASRNFRGTDYLVAYLDAIFAAKDSLRDRTGNYIKATVLEEYKFVSDTNFAIPKASTGLSAGRFMAISDFYFK